MMYWPRPSEIQFRMPVHALRAGCEIVEARISEVDRCWRNGAPGDYIPHTKTYHYEEIDQTARTHLLGHLDKVEMPVVMMLGNSHVAFKSGSQLFALLREMSDLGYLENIPFAVYPWDIQRFRYYFENRKRTSIIETPMLELMGVE